MANKAFVVVNGISGERTSTVHFIRYDYLVVGPDEVNVSDANSTSLNFDYGDSRDDIREKIKAQIRSQQGDSTIHVEFVGF